ncbi:MAG: hypothetical protein LC637_00005, partial [Xanthomonadaceae bacterium]|nr:hypothetical protein [Xanthomonadaceae bacterium]
MSIMPLENPHLKTSGRPGTCSAITGLCWRKFCFPPPCIYVCIKEQKMIHPPRSGVGKPIMVLILTLLALPALTVIASDESPFHPPEGDPSAFTGPDFSDLPKDLPLANQGSFEGSDNELETDAWRDNVLQPVDQRDDGEDKFDVFNVPSNGPPSPLFGAEPFTQKMFRFEEFGREQLDLEQTTAPEGWTPLPSPLDPAGFPNGYDLEYFLKQDIWPIPTKFANDLD